MVETREPLGMVDFEPLAHGRLIALVALCNLWDAPALGIEQHIAAAFGDLRADDWRG